MSDNLFFGAFFGALFGFTGTMFVVLGFLLTGGTLSAGWGSMPAVLAVLGSAVGLVIGLIAWDERW